MQVNPMCSCLGFWPDLRILCLFCKASGVLGCGVGAEELRGFVGASGSGFRV